MSLREKIQKIIRLKKTPINFCFITYRTEINGRFLKFLGMLEPYGPGNLRPIFTAKNVTVEGLPQIIGKSYDTLKFMVKYKQSTFEVIFLLRGVTMKTHLFHRLQIRRESEPL